MQYFDSGKPGASNKSLPVKNSFWTLGAVFLLVVAAISNFGLVFFNLQPVYRFHAEVLLLCRLLLPLVTVLILFTGPKSLLRLLGLVFFVPLAAIGLICAGLFWELAMQYQKPWLSHEEECQGAHYKAVHMKRGTYAMFSGGWTKEDGETYSIWKYRYIGPFLYQKVGEIDLPTNLWPAFVLTGDDQLSIELRRENFLILKADVEDVLSGRVKLGH